MVIIPELEIGLFNGWIPFAVYIIIFGITMACFPKAVRARLYDRSLWTDKQKILTTIGKLFSFTNIVLFFLSPVRFYLPVFIIGTVLWIAGVTGLITALINYRNTSLDVPVTRGLYRISRNPQIFSIWIIFLGICFLIGSGLSLFLFIISLVFLHTSVLAEENACLKQYGDSYRIFMDKVPRYFLFF